MEKVYGLDLETGFPVLINQLKKRDMANYISIPELQLEVSNGKLYARVQGFYSQQDLDRFTSYNPKIWLFRWTYQKKYSREGMLDYYRRKSGIKWRHPRVKGNFIKDVEFTFPSGKLILNEKVGVGIDLSQWFDINQYYDDQQEPTGFEVRLRRKSRRYLSMDNSSPSGSSITANFGLAIVLDNPTSGVKPYKIWGKISPFQIAATIQENGGNKLLQNDSVSLTYRLMKKS